MFCIILVAKKMCLCGMQHTVKYFINGLVKLVPFFVSFDITVLISLYSNLMKSMQFIYLF